MQISRRQFNFGLGSLAFAGISARAYSQIPPAARSEVAGYGALIRDPNTLIDLPKGFSYRVISRFGNVMDDGHVVPSAGDGMGAFAFGKGKVALVRNHELSARDARFGPFTGKVADDFATYDRGKDGAPLPGGTTTLIYDMKSQRVESQFLSLSGTIRNCAGGITPWGSWLSCEENTTRAGDAVGKDHGFVFEVPSAHKGLVAPVPLTAMGRFNHEAACVEPRTGIVYLTEDRDDSLLYRFLPAVKGELAKGGRLEALVIDGIADSRNWSEAVVTRGKPTRRAGSRSTVPKRPTMICASAARLPRRHCLRAAKAFGGVQTSCISLAQMVVQRNLARFSGCGPGWVQAAMHWTYIMNPPMRRRIIMAIT